MKYLLSIIGFLLMAAPALAVDKQELEFMINFFNHLQQKSLETKSEFCGFIGLDENGHLITTIPIKGNADSCYSDNAPLDFNYIASYHTHGAFSIDKDSELPSPADLKADIGDGVNGYIATPGGRIWFNDKQKKTATLVCENCVPLDPNFDGDSLQPTKKFYTVKTLYQRWEDDDEDETAEQQEPDFVAEDLEFVKKLFNSIQQKSFADNREYCGYIGVGENNQLIATKANQGDINGCVANDPPAEMALYASYHTHGAYSATADTEVPSFDDIQADMGEELYGFVATPGGRVWRIDGQQGTASLQCGRNCILSDPKFDDETVEPFENSYTLEALKIRQSD